MKKSRSSPENIIIEIENISKKCVAIEKELPRFLMPFFLYMQQSMQPKTRLAYLRELKNFFTFVKRNDAQDPDTIRSIDDSYFQNMDVSEINDYLDYSSLDSEGGNGASAVMRKRAVLSTFLKYMYSNGTLNRDIAADIKHIRSARKKEPEIKRLSEAEVIKMLDSALNGSMLSEKEKQYWAKTRCRDYAILLLFITYGLRVQELMRLNLSDFDLNKKEFMLYRNNGETTQLPLSERAAAALEDYLKNERRVRDDIPEYDKEALFLSLKGYRLSERQIREVSKKYTSMGMCSDRKEGFSPQKLRATVASALIEKGNSLNDIQELMHYDNFSTTKIYGQRKKSVNKEIFKDLQWSDGRR